MKKEDIDMALKSLQEVNGGAILPNRMYTHIPNAAAELRDCLARLTGKYTWLPEYDKVADWLENNDGKGLLCIGNCGRGKTMMCYRVIPILLYHFAHKIVSCYDAVDINAKIDVMKQKHIICVDDIGTESDYLVYGVRRQPLAELIDSAEKRSSLLLLTTNLTTDDLEEKYGIRVLDRLKRVTKVIHFVGNSLR